MPDILETVQEGGEAGTEAAPKEAETSSQEDGDPAGGGHCRCLDYSPAGRADHVLRLVAEMEGRVCFLIQNGY